jgi:RNA polymerase sigma-70 factor (ECF subfamily)
MNDLPDADLWQRVRDDDADAFGLLFERHGERIHGFALRRTADATAAEDVTAIVFLEAWRRRHQVVLHQPSALPWLYGVAANVLRGSNRARRRHQAALERLAGQRPPTLELVELRSEALEQARSIITAVGRLPRRERDVLALSVWEGLSHDEIAAALDVPVGTVKSRLSRARARLEPHRQRSFRSGTSGSASVVPAVSAIPAELALKEGFS